MWCKRSICFAVAVAFALAADLTSLAGTPHAADPVSFRNDVMAVISKFGCNAGTCHGNANGKAGFKLSLRGEDPNKDFLALTRDQFGRRTNPLDPDQSLILLKATTQIAHEGGQRFKQKSEAYHILREWIDSGAKMDPPDTPHLEQLTVQPAHRILVEPADQVQLEVQATFSNGETREVTEWAVYEPADTKIASVTPDGIARRESMGETTVLVRYLNRQQPVRLAFVPARPDFVWNPIPESNFIDHHIFAKLRTLRMTPSPLCSDATFIRRAYLDLLGILPTAEEARVFVANPAQDKRSRLIDRLLTRPEFADYWALKWSDLLRNEERVLDRKGTERFHHWIRQSLAENKPLDQFVRELVAARGSTYQNPPANFYRAIREPKARAEAAAQVFLGLRLKCAQCHNHPFDRWTQEDYYDWGSLFARIDYKILQNRRRDSNDGHEFKGEQIVYVSRKGNLNNPTTGKPADPRFLASNRSVSDRRDMLQALADWITSPGNPYFARAQINRIWFHLMGRGMVEPIDDFRPTNPASHPELLDALAQRFVEEDFNLRAMIRLIMNSRTYQLSAEPNWTNRDDALNYSHALVRRLTAEQLLDCQSQVLGVPVPFPGYPSGTRAAQLPGALAERKRGSQLTSIDQFLQVFGKPSRLLTCECERSAETTMSQAFVMISGETLNDLLTHKNNRLSQLLASNRSADEMIEHLYWTALTRAPTAAERDRAIQYVKAHPERRRQALEDLTWSLINAKEFLLRN